MRRTLPSAAAVGGDDRFARNVECFDRRRVSPEVMVRGISETANGSASLTAFDPIGEFSKNVDVIAVAADCLRRGRDERVRSRIVTERPIPVVVDADGPNGESPWNTRGRGLRAADHLTPHEGDSQSCSESKRTRRLSV